MIYVDRLRETKKSRDWPFPSGCHLLADSVEELHEFAARLGMKRCWFQSAARLPHYDLNARRRAQAIELGAKEIDRREMSRRIRAARGIKTEATIVQDEWRGCYRESWKGVIVDESMVHPAKFSRRLIKKIYDHLFECGLLAAGHSVIDPFGGIALGALEAMRHGCHWQGVELEPRFQAFGVQNLALWNVRYSSLHGWGTARIHCGDSRRLLDVIRSADACVSSPPFNANQSNAIHGQTKGFHSHGKNQSKNRMKRDYLLAETDGNLGNMEMDDNAFQAAISSPPFADSIGSDDPDKRGGVFTKDEKRRNDKSLTGTYGTSVGQLGALQDDYDAVISSPPFAESLGGKENRGGVHPAHDTQNRTYQDYGNEPGQLGALRDDYDACVSSPPYEGAHTGAVDDTSMIPDRAGRAMIGGYGNAHGQLSIESGRSFWAAARDIVSQTYEALVPGGVACWVTKNYVKNGAIVDFPGRWRQLCESVGFVTIHKHHALQVEHKAEQGGLFGESKQIKSSRKSFFKLIHEKKRPDLAIDYEVVWCMVKPK